MSRDHVTHVNDTTSSLTGAMRVLLIKYKVRVSDSCGVVRDVKKVYSALLINKINSDLRSLSNVFFLMILLTRDLIVK